jgi:outer membrane lipoprotein SlyB
MDANQQLLNNAKNNSKSDSNNVPEFTERLRHSKALIPTMAVMGVTVMALAAALVVNRSEAQPGGADTRVASALTGNGSAPVSKLAADTAKRPHTNTPKNINSPSTVAQSSCSHCGTVEAVTAVQRQGQVNGVAVGNSTIGLGTVAGGVVGGLLGNQMGGGNGKTAMTVLGVAGGAFAGNAIEKNMNKVTVYQMRVRMHDGSVRTIEQASAVAAGSRVVVEGNTVRPVAPATSSAASVLNYSAQVA